MHLLGVFAHPDDEAYQLAGCMARYTDEGIGATILCFTRGEAGQITEGSGATRETLGEVRERELREACRVVGCDDVRIVGTPDSGTVATPDGVEAIVSVIRDVRPEVVVTMEPGGITKHGDHIAVSQMTADAVRAVEDEGIVHRLFFSALPESALELWRRLAEESGGVAFDPDDPFAPQASDDALVACIVNVAAQIDRKVAALWAHRTQSQEFIASQPDAVTKILLASEWFQRPYPPFRPGEPVGDDLFEGLR